MNPALAAIVIDAVYESDLCVDGFIVLPDQQPVPVRIKPDMGDVSLQFTDVNISGQSFMFRVRVSEFAERPAPATVYYADPADARAWKIVSASRKDNARLEWHCVAQKVK